MFFRGGFFGIRMSNFWEIKFEKTYLKARITTRASKNILRTVRDGMLLVDVTTIPENNKANEAVIEIISDKFDVPKSKIFISAGAKSRNKTICIEKKIDEKFLEKLESEKNNL